MGVRNEPKSEPNRGKQQQKTKYGITREPKKMLSFILSGRP